MGSLLAKTVGRTLARFLSVREGARRFHDEIGKDANPDYCFADFLVRVRRGDEAGLEKAYGSVRTKAALSESTGGASGGYLVPAELRNDLMADVAEESIIRPRALVVPMTSATLSLPIPDTGTAQAAGTPAVYGGILMNWTTEAKSETETEPTFRQVELKANDLTGYALASNTLLDDGGKPLEAWLRRLFARSVGWHEDFAFMQGSGIGKPLGVLNSNAAKTVTRSAVTTFKYVDAQAMLALLLPHSYAHAIWLVTAGAMGQLVQLLNAAGNPTWEPNELPIGAEGSMGSLFGRPVFVTEKLPALGTKGDVILFDPSLYVIGDRQAVEIAYGKESSLTAFQKNQAAWRITERVGGRPWMDAPVTLQDNVTVVSPIVILT